MTDGTEKLAEEIGKPRKVALHTSLEYSFGYLCVMEVRYSNLDEHYERLPEGTQREAVLPGYARVSEVFEIPGFKPLTRDELMANAVSGLDEQERQAYIVLEKTLAGIRERKAQLLALTHQPSGPQAGDERPTA